MAGAGGVLVGRGYVSIRPEFEGDWSRSVNSRASSAGKSGSAAFGKAFGAGLKGIGALAGVAVAANLNAAAASAALLAPALTTAGAAAGALKLGMSGVGDAFKAAFADTSKQASGAASSTRAVEAAQRGLATAQRALADARVQAAERVQDALRSVEDAERKLSRTVADAARDQADAKRKVQDAVRELAESQEDARDVQADLTKARKDAAREIEDLNSKLANSRLEEREAALAMADAEKALRAAQAKPGNRAEDIAKLQLAYDQAAQAVADQALETKQLSEDAAKANKAGVEGSDKVQQAQERIADAQRKVEDRTRALAQAREEQRRTEVDSAQDIADAQRALGEAQRGVDEARADGARQIADAQRAVADAAAAVADAQQSAAGQASAFDDAMAKLAPNAQSFVRAVQGLAPAWRDMKLAVQNRLFEGLDETVTTLGRATIPVLKRGLVGIAGVWNQMAKNAAGAITEMAKTGLLDKIVTGARDNLAAFAKAPGQIVTALGQLSVAAQPAFNALSQQMAGALTSFTDGIAKSFASGGLEQAISSAFGILSQFGTLLGNVLGTVSQIFKAASDAGGEIVGALGAVFGELRKVLATDEMQAQLRSLFGSVSQIVSAIVPVIGAIVQAAVPLLNAIAAPVAQLAQVLGPVLIQVTQALGAALLPVIQSLGPVLVTVGTAIVQLVQAVTPLLQPIADLIAGVISALAPALTPIVTVITDLVGVLIGPLTQIVTALTPVLQVIGQAITQVFQALQPMLAPLVQLIGQVAELLAGVLTTAVSQLMPVLQPLIDTGMQLVEAVFAALQPLLPVIRDAVETLGGALLQMLPAFVGIAEAAGQLVEGLAPLIPVGVQLISEVLSGLTPVLPVIADAFVSIADAAVAIAAPLAEFVAGLAQQLAPVIADLAPLLGDVVGMLAGVLPQILPPLAAALVSLVEAVAPILPLFGELVGMVLRMGAGVIMDLLPAILQLVQAGIDLTVALLPLVPPLAQLIGLVVELAVKVLSWLLPPLLQFAGFLIGGLAGALSTVIGWVAGLVSGIAGLITWVTDKLGPAFRNLKDKVIIPVWNGIKTALSTAWSAIKTYVLYPIKDFFTKTIPSWSTTLKSRVTGSWNGLRDGASNAWKNLKSWVIWPIRDFFTKTIPGWGTQLKDKLVDAFEAARDGIKTAWDKLKEIAKSPISFVINTVYNRGIVGVWNKIAKAFGAPELKEFHPKGFARGGVYDVLPGYTPGRDPHKFYSPSGMALEMSGGESIFRPEFTRAVGSGFVSTMNYLAKSGGAARVREALAPVLGGNPRTPTDRSLRYASGGTFRFADGGVFGWIKDTARAAVGAGSKAWNLVKEGTTWLGDTLERSARAGVKHVVDPLLRSFPGMDTGFGQAIRRISTKIIDALFGYSKEADDKGAGGIGGPRIQAGLKWAKTQDGLPYQWGGNGNPSWDCSGLVSAIESVIRGQTPHRRWATGAFHGKTAPPGWVLHGASPYRIGITNAGVGHTAGTIGGVNVESRGGDGVVIGKGARGYRDRLFTDWYGFQPGKYDDGGWLPPGGLGYNGLATPEAVFTPGQLKSLEGAAAVGIAAAQGAGSITINARTADFTVADLERVQRVQEARARVGRPR
ncbi:tape measure protein [Streptomyces phage Kromp]|uniref:Tape measure protein n=1 Tax=Streptomyces phage Kromp TaxID=2315619 RepID=A0A386K8E1_9CAUD|nr:tape measure protein [Streptomyces phage Kromp]